MRLGIFDQWGAQNSQSVWPALYQGIARVGHSAVSHDWDADMAVIWSLVWAGRMRSNQQVWQHYRQRNRPVLVVEVGTLCRGHTWKLGINGLGSGAFWGREQDPLRSQHMAVQLRPWREPGSDIVIVLQRDDSEQWQGLPPTVQWLSETIANLRQYTDRPIRVRPHPRRATPAVPGVIVDRPLRSQGTRDDYDLDTSLSRAWAVINVNSGAGVNAVIRGTPLFAHASSLAAPVAGLDWSQIEQPLRPDRDQWFQDLCHTEWTLAEIASGQALARLL